jgi:hypothetical protein
VLGINQLCTSLKNTFNRGFHSHDKPNVILLSFNNSLNLSSDTPQNLQLGGKNFSHFGFVIS